MEEKDAVIDKEKIIKHLVEQGKKLIHEYNHNNWEKDVRCYASFPDDTGLLQIIYGLKTIEQLSNGAEVLKCAQDLANTEYVHYFYIVGLVLRYSPYGPDYAETTYKVLGIEINEPTRKLLDEVREENKNRVIRR